MYIHNKRRKETKMNTKCELINNVPTSSYRKRFEAVFTKLGVQISLDSRGNTQDTWEDLHKLANFWQIDGNKKFFSTINL